MYRRALPLLLTAVLLLSGCAAGQGRNFTIGEIVAPDSGDR